jgi:hypothetical protein
LLFNDAYLEAKPELKTVRQEYIQEVNSPNPDTGKLLELAVLYGYYDERVVNTENSIENKLIERTRQIEK